ncbi:MAG TPA: iron-containing alcohol dehydrogenase [Methanomassiliicoccales archaeon]|nr:iron-containing alcohol dehydrogenase [Methanomassiliicoccales archaeon]
MWQFTSPRNIFFGEDSLEMLEELEGEKALIIAGQTVKRLGIIDKVAELLAEADIEVGVIDNIEPEPSIETVKAVAEIAKDFEPDWIIGLGGGSSMDAAKAIWALYERPDLDVGDISPLETLGLRKKARFMCIPTTSGSGSEATWATVITDREGKVKRELASRELIPDIVILEPWLTSTMPPHLTASSGMDALTHAIEAYVSNFRNDFSDTLAIKAMQMIFEHLPRAVSDGEDMEAREKMQNAATMAGIAFSNSFVGMAHALGHSVGAIFGIDHGKAVAMFLPHVIRYNGEEVASRYAEILAALEIDFEFEEDAPNILAQALVELMMEIGLPCEICETGIHWKDYEAELENLVERALMSSANLAGPREAESDDYREIIVVAFGSVDKD